MAREISAVLEYGAPAPSETAAIMRDKLRYHTDSWDLSVDLKAGVSEIVVIDARSRNAYAAGHIPSAVSFPHREMSAETTAQLDAPLLQMSEPVKCDHLQQLLIGLTSRYAARATAGPTAEARLATVIISAGSQRPPPGLVAADARSGA